MVHGHCRTNLDNYKQEEWPKEFVRVPLKGERVQAESGNSLRVCEITHTIFERYKGNVPFWTPGVIIELHK
jgi:hypothetical protein